MASQKQPELFGRVKSLLTLKSDGVNRDGSSRAKIEPANKKKGAKTITVDKSKPKKAKTKTNKKESTPSINSSEKPLETKNAVNMTEDTKKEVQSNQDKINKRKPEPVYDPDEDLTPLERAHSSEGQPNLQSVPIVFRSSMALSNRSSTAYMLVEQLEKQKKEAYDLAKLEMLTGGFLDTAALESNAALLALLLKQATNDGFFWTVVALVVVAVCLQVCIGVILAFRFRSTLDMEEGGPQTNKKGGCFDRLDASCWCSPKVLLFFAAVLLMILNVVNMFIIAFAGQVNDGGGEVAATAEEIDTPQVQ